MRPPPGLWWLYAVLCVALTVSLPAQVPEGTRPYKVGDLSFQIPAGWRVQTAPDDSPPKVIFTAEDGQNGRLTVARMPVPNGPGKPLDPKLNPMTAPETADYRVALQEAGLTPISGAIRTAVEGGHSVETVSFQCKAEGGRDALVLITTWRSSEQVLRARLQIPAGSSPAVAAALTSVRRSVQFRNSPTLGFGDFVGNPMDSARVAALSKTTPSPTAPAPGKPASPAHSVTPGASIAQMVQDYRASLVFIESGSGAGSGFVCQTKDGVHLLTNQHVLAGMAAPRFTRLDGATVTAGAGTAAVGHDLMRFTTQGETRPLVAMTTVESEAQVGDEIVVLGNLEGARVIQPLPGKLVGIGPDRVEVTAEFLPGNSGSPIVHVKSGKVIGIATYLMKRQHAEFTDSKDTKVRRFGFRLDSVKQWQPLNWQAFQQDKATMDSVESTTRDIIQLIQDMQGKQGPSPAAYRNSSVVRAVRDLETVIKRQGLSVADRKRAFQNFLASIRAATQADIAQARQTIRYDFFTQSLREEAQVREEMYKLFDRILKAR